MCFLHHLAHKRSKQTCVTAAKIAWEVISTTNDTSREQLAQVIKNELGMLQLQVQCS